MILHGFYTESELIRRFDERLSPARYAGNDDVMDLKFVGTRRGNKIKLFRRSGTSGLFFSSVFRGQIVTEDKRAIIKGYFTKSIADYFLSAFWLGFVYIIFQSAKQRGTTMSTANFLAGASILAVILLLRTGKKTKKEYIEVLLDVTGRQSDKDNAEV